MQQESCMRRSSGAKAIALDQRVLLARYRLLTVLGLLVSAVTALGLHLWLGR